MLSWPGFKPGLLQPQCRELTTIRPQGTTGLRLEIWPTACLSDAERELKSLLGTSKKTQPLLIGITASSVVSRMQTCAGRTQWISSPSPYPLGHDYGNVSFPTRLTQAATSHPVEVGFTMLTLGTHSTASFLGLSYLSHSVHFFGHEIGCTWALPMILRDYFCLQPASCLGCRKAAHDSKEL